MAWISFIDRDRAIFHAKIGLQTADVPREGSFCAYSILNGWVVEIPDAREDPIHASNPLVVGKDGVRFYAAAPLAFENKTRIGTIAVADVVPRNLDDFEMVALMRAAEDIEDELRTRYAHMVFEGAAPLSSVADR
jgi:GAF domain-containing protein